MGPSDDHPDEMDRLSSEQVEAILSGRDVDDPAASRAASAVAEIRRSLLEGPSPDVAARHLAAMAAAAPDAQAELSPVLQLRPGRRRMRILTRRRVAALGLAATLTLFGGLATAGALPGPAQDLVAGAASHLGIHLPSSHDPSETPGEHGEAVSTVAQDPSLEGCDKGQAVSATASSMAADHRQDEAEKPDPCAQAEGTGSGSEPGSEGAGSPQGSGGGSGGPGGGSGGPGGGSGGGGSSEGSGGGFGGPGGGSGGGGSAEGSGGGSGAVPQTVPTPIP